MKELLQLLLEEAEAEERTHWYESGYEIEDRALQALQNVIRRAQARLEEEN
jgi:hypothetical protein